MVIALEIDNDGLPVTPETGGEFVCPLSCNRRAKLFKPVRHQRLICHAMLDRREVLYEVLQNNCIYSYQLS